MSENYLVINGKKMDLTEEQLKQLGIKVRKNPFERVNEGKKYWCIDESNDLCDYLEQNDLTDTTLYNIANYFNDDAFANQVALHQLLYRKLLKFAYDNEFEGTNEPNQYYVNYCPRTGSYTVQLDCGFRALCTHFSSYEACERAIKEVVKPFVAQYPEFKW